MPLQKLTLLKVLTLAPWAAMVAFLALGAGPTLWHAGLVHLVVVGIILTAAAGASGWGYWCLRSAIEPVVPDRAVLSESECQQQWLATMPVPALLLSAQGDTLAASPRAVESGLTVLPTPGRDAKCYYRASDGQPLPPEQGRPALLTALPLGLVLMESPTPQGPRCFLLQTADRASDSAAPLLLVFADVTGLIDSERRLRRANEELRRFAYAASHDLHEPLRSISGFVQLIGKRKAEESDPQTAQFIQHAVAGVTQMQSLLNGLLDYSTITEFAVLPSEPVDAAAVMEKVLRNLRQAIQENGARVTHAPLPTLLVHGAHLLQLLQNHISNALKYRSEAPPDIHVSASPRGQQWVFAVRDNGIGIDPKHHERVFGLFKRLHGRKYPGAGIGLSICSKIVEHYGGRVWLESELGKGSIFYFTLPMQGGATLDPKAESTVSRAAGGR